MATQNKLIVGETVSSVRRNFARPHLTSWNAICSFWGVEEMP